MQRWIVVALVAMFAVPMAAAFANPDVFVFTERGNKFKIEEERENQGGDLTGCQDGYIHLVENGDVVIVDGEGICVPGSEVPDPDADQALDAVVSSIHSNSRLVDIGRDGKMAYVRGEYGLEQSLYPYMGFSGNDDKAAVIYADTTPQVINIPSVYRNYTFATEGNDRDLQNLEASVTERVTKIGSTADEHNVKYHVESHEVSGDGLVFIRLPDEADGSKITYDRSSNGKVRLLYLDDDILSYDFSDFGDFSSLGTYSHEIPFVADDPLPYMTLNPTDISAHHVNDWENFKLEMKFSGTTQLELCTPDDVRYGHVEETVNRQIEPWKLEGQGTSGHYKVWPYTLANDIDDKDRKARQDIRDIFNTYNNAIYGGDRDRVTVLPESDPGFDGVLKYCNGGATYFIHNGVRHSPQTIVISYEFTPQVLDFNKNPIANLTSWLGDFSLIGSGERIVGVTDNTYLVVESDADPTQIRIRYDIRVGQVDQVQHVETNPFFIVAQRTFENTDVSFEADRLTVTGTGRVLLQIDTDNPANVANIMSVNGDLSDGTTLRLVESPYDLINIRHSSANGFKIANFYHGSSPESINVLAGSLEDSTKSSIFSYYLTADYTVYHGKCCKGKYTVPFSEKYSGTSTNFQISDKNGYKEINRVEIRTAGLPDNWLPTGAKLFRINDGGTTKYFTYAIYDKLPAKSDGSEFTGTFSDDFNIPPRENIYLVIDSAGGTSILNNIAPPQVGMQITGLSAITNPDGTKPLGVPYYLERNGIGIKSGIVLDKITAEIDHYGLSLSTKAKLYLYHDALVAELDGSKIIYFDGKNNEIEKDNAPGDPYIYNPFSYVKMPRFSSPVNITQIELRSTTDEFGEFASMRLPYLDNENQTRFTEKFIPIIPGFQEVNMLVNGTEVKMKLEDIPKDNEKTYIPERTVSAISYSNDTSDSRAETSTSASFVAKTTGEVFVEYDVNLEAEVKYSVSSTTQTLKTKYHSVFVGSGDLKKLPGGAYKFVPHIVRDWTPIPRPATSNSEYSDRFARSLENNQLSEMTLTANIIINGIHRETKQLISSDDVQEISTTNTHRTVHAKFAEKSAISTFAINVEAGDFVEIVFTGKIATKGTTNTSTGISYTERNDRSNLYNTFGRYANLGFDERTYLLTNTIAVSTGSISMGPGAIEIYS